MKITKAIIKQKEKLETDFAEWVLNVGYMHVHYHNISRWDVDHKKITSKQLLVLYRKSKKIK